MTDTTSVMPVGCRIRLSGRNWSINSWLFYSRLKVKMVCHKVKQIKQIQMHYYKQFEASSSPKWTNWTLQVERLAELNMWPWIAHITEQCWNVKDGYLLQQKCFLKVIPHPPHTPASKNFWTFQKPTIQQNTIKCHLTFYLTSDYFGPFQVPHPWTTWPLLRRQGDLPWCENLWSERC